MNNNSTAPTSDKGDKEERGHEVQNVRNQEYHSFEEWALERTKALNTYADETMAQEVQGAIRAAVMAVLLLWERDILQYVDDDPDPAFESLREKTEAARRRSTESLTWKTPLEPFVRALFNGHMPTVIRALVPAGQKKLLEICRIGSDECVFVDGDLALRNPLPGDDIVIVRELSLKKVRAMCNALLAE